MTVGKACTRSVVTAHPEETVQEVAQRMAQYDVGTLIVIEAKRPVGIITDRDLVLRVISTYTKIFLYPTLEFAQCRMLWDDDLLRHGSRHKSGLRADSTEAGVQRRCDSSKG